jgi:hypothetical protein
MTLCKGSIRSTRDMLPSEGELLSCDFICFFSRVAQIVFAVDGCHLLTRVGMEEEDLSIDR